MTNRAMKLAAGCVVACLYLLTSAMANEPPPLEAYGSLPNADLVAVSPSGKRLAMRRTQDGIDVVLVIDLETGERTAAVNVSETNPRSLRFISDESLLLVVGETTRLFYVRGAFDYSAAFVMNTNTGEVRQLLTRAKNLWSAQSGLGRIVGAAADGSKLYMPAFESESSTYDPKYSLFEIGVTNKRERLKRGGTAHTVDWFVDENGEPIIREDYNNQSNTHTLWRVDGRSREKLYEYESEIRLMSPEGLLPDRSAIVYRAYNGDRLQFFTMSIDTAETDGPILSRDDRSIERVFLDSNRIVLGVQYSGFKPSYRFFDEALDRRINAIQKALPDTAVRLHSWSDDFSRLVVQVTGGWNAGAFLLFTKGEAEPQVVAAERPLVPNSAVVPTEITTYTARDGLEIPALVTVSPEIRESGNAPLIVLPHGGPESYDAFGFDWKAQYFASRGYVVLQPQFRGSDGFGWDFISAGRGEWGRKMQYDLDDGVAHLTQSGLVDPTRVCIVGASYGGYAAMAAAAFSDGIYRCAVAVNGVFDLREMILDRRRDYGRDHWVISYWQNLYGTDGIERKALDAISPA
ncbi:MAG: alpha/beta fold hydrolase, partial [Pseudomonadota bacterium]